ncbi:MAG TPA: hypothetical protein VIL55_04305, partial [Naasia sp.]
MSKRKKPDSTGPELDTAVVDAEIDSLEKEFAAELVPTQSPRSRRAPAEPETLTVTIDLPPSPVHEMPEDEAVVAIDDDPVITPSAVP